MADAGLFANLEVLARLAAEFGGRLVLHPSIEYEPSEGTEYLASRCEVGPSDNDELLKLAFFDPMIVLVGLRTFRPGERMAPPHLNLVPAGMQHLARLGRIHAVCQTWRALPDTAECVLALGGPAALRRDQSIILRGHLSSAGSAALEDANFISNYTMPIDWTSRGDIILWSRPLLRGYIRERLEVPPRILAADTAWSMHVSGEFEQERLKAEQERRQLAERCREEERQVAERRRQDAELLSAQIREIRIAAGNAERERFRARLGDSILRVVSDSGDYAHRAVEYRRLPDGSVLFFEFADADGRTHADEPLHRTKFTTLGNALAATFKPSEQDPEMNPVELELKVGRSELIEAFKAAGISRTYFILDDEPLGFDGEDIVHWRIAEGTELVEIENELKVIWNFHCGVETSGLWTKEYYEVIGKKDGIYYYIDSGDSDGYFVKLGRFPNDDDAIEAGKALGMTDATRAELFASSEEGATE